MTTKDDASTDPSRGRASSIVKVITVKRAHTPAKSRTQTNSLDQLLRDWYLSYFSIRPVLRCTPDYTTARWALP